MPNAFEQILTDEQRSYQEVAERFAAERLAPGYQERDASEMLDPGIIREMGALGLIGSDLPEEFGGLGLDGFTNGLLFEAIAHADINVGYLQLVGSLMGKVIAKFAHPEVSAQWLPKIIAGEAVVGLGLTEPRGGSDAANLILRAQRVGDEYILDGEKTSMSFSDQADGAVVFARTGKADDGARGVSGFMVPLDLPGIKRTRFRDVGTKCVGRGSVFFDSVRIPANHLLGSEGGGFVQIMQGFDYSRALIGLQCMGAAQASVDESWTYIQEREAFGSPLARYQGVTFPLAEADTMLMACRQLCYHTLRLRDLGKEHTAEAAMCKWLGPKTAVDVIHQCLLTHGHYGYTMDMAHQQRLRDVMGLEIGDGTAQIMKMIVARRRIGSIAAQHQTRRQA
ncbi:cyclohexanecarboxyl-CoA dehydrogenase [Rhodoligotrophos appendicifer]|uniref:acyl-CoA dehydrogenase family protein n=1 Tax=Rhodoligotrophos appendicifer TaxID=987056 RepID=UPI0011852216|nr:acyl-CoA dehydrogenase family protein [Rhodoligotrophos appendicifer]